MRRGLPRLAVSTSTGAANKLGKNLVRASHVVYSLSAPTEAPNSVVREQWIAMEWFAIILDWPDQGQDENYISFCHYTDHWSSSRTWHVLDIMLLLPCSLSRRKWDSPTGFYMPWLEICPTWNAKFRKQNRWQVLRLIYIGAISPSGANKYYIKRLLSFPFMALTLLETDNLCKIMIVCVQLWVR